MPVFPAIPLHGQEMEKNLIAAALSGIFMVAAAHAQSSASVYGILDTGLVKESGSDLKMGDYMASRIGFRGNEDLGNGLKATFELEQRFRLYNGVKTGSYTWDESIRTQLGRDSNTEWTGYANVGLAGQWGSVRLGRVMDMIAETFTQIDPFDENGIATSYSYYSFLHSHFLNNSVRYESPDFNGAGFGLSYTVGGDKQGDSPEARFLKKNGNDGFAVSPHYNNGPLMLLANFERVADSGNSYLWDIGGTYQWGNTKFFLGYERTILKLDERAGSSGNQTEWLAGIQYRIGPHTFLASYDRGEIDAGRYNGHASKYAVGYDYNFSKRTFLYINAVHIDSTSDRIGAIYNSNGAPRDSMNGWQIGINHTF